MNAKGKTAQLRFYRNVTTMSPSQRNGCGFIIKKNDGVSRDFPKFHTPAHRGAQDSEVNFDKLSKKFPTENLLCDFINMIIST